MSSPPESVRARPGRKAPRVEPPAPLKVGFILVPDFPLMAYSAAVEPLRAANTLSGCPLYQWWHAARAAARCGPRTASPSSPTSRSAA
nr:hypothetical protein [Methylobacterium durans]